MTRRLTVTVSTSVIALLAPLTLAVAPASAASCAPGWSDVGGATCELVVDYNGSAPGDLPTVIGTAQTATVPAGVTSLAVVARGAEGATSADPAEGSGTSPGGAGGRESATVPVTPGNVLTIIVGESGASVPPGGWSPCPTCPNSGAFGGGGLASSSFGGHGGGGTFVFDGLAPGVKGSGALLVAAGGGGGGGYDYNTTASHGAYGAQKAPGGGGSGAAPAADGGSAAFQYDPTFNPPTHYPPGGGHGATSSAPGTGGHSPIPPSFAFGQVDGLAGTGPASIPDRFHPESTPGYLGRGGDAQKGTCCYYYGEAGGGGGGYYGGGSGGTIEADLEGGGGGGGAGYVSALATTASSQTAAWSGDGSVTLRYTTTPSKVSYLTTSANPARAGQALALTAHLTNGAVTGSVRFFDGAKLLATKPAISGKAVLSISTLVVGSHLLTCSVPGQSRAAPLLEVVQRASTATKLAVGPNPASRSTLVGLRATVRRLAPAARSVAGGKVAFYDGTRLLGVRALTRGAATLTVKFPAKGAHRLTASYQGATSDNASSSKVVTLTIR